MDQYQEIIDRALAGQSLTGDEILAIDHLIVGIGITEAREVAKVRAKYAEQRAVLIEAIKLVERRG